MGSREQESGVWLHPSVKVLCSGLLGDASTIFALKKIWSRFFLRLFSIVGI